MSSLVRQQNVLLMRWSILRCSCILQAQKCLIPLNTRKTKPPVFPLTVCVMCKIPSNRSWEFYWAHGSYVGGTVATFECKPPPSNWCWKLDSWGELANICTLWRWLLFIILQNLRGCCGTQQVHIMYVPPAGYSAGCISSCIPRTCDGNDSINFVSHS